MTPTSNARPLRAAATLAAAALLQAAGAFAQDIAAGERKAIAAKPLSDDDIRDLAAYYAAIQIEVRALPQ